MNALRLKCSITSLICSLSSSIVGYT